MFQFAYFILIFLIPFSWSLLSISSFPSFCVIVFIILLNAIDKKKTKFSLELHVLCFIARYSIRCYLLTHTLIGCNVCNWLARKKAGGTMNRFEAVKFLHFVALKTMANHSECLSCWYLSNNRKCVHCICCAHRHFFLDIGNWQKENEE